MTPTQHEQLKALGYDESIDPVDWLIREVAILSGRRADEIATNRDLIRALNAYERGQST